MKYETAIANHLLSLLRRRPEGHHTGALIKAHSGTQWPRRRRSWNSAPGPLPVAAARPADGCLAHPHLPGCMHCHNQAFCGRLMQRQCNACMPRRMQYSMQRCTHGPCMLGQTEFPARKAISSSSENRMHIRTVHLGRRRTWRMCGRSALRLLPSQWRRPHRSPPHRTSRTVPLPVPSVPSCSGGCLAWQPHCRPAGSWRRRRPVQQCMSDGSVKQVQGHRSTYAHIGCRRHVHASRQVTKQHTLAATDGAAACVCELRCGSALWAAAGCSL